MPAVMHTIPAIVPGMTETITTTAKEREVCSWPGLRSWRSPDSYDAARGLWIDKLHAGYVDGSMVNRHTGVPAVTTISGTDWLTFGNVAKLGRITNTDYEDFNPSEFTIAFAFHPNGMSGHDPIFSEPYDATTDSSNKYLRLIALDNTSNMFFRLGSMGASETNIAVPSSGTGLRSKSTPVIVVMSYSAARGYTLRLASGDSITNVASPTSAQTINRGGLQIGGTKQSTGAGDLLYGGIGDLFIFDIDLTGSAYAGLLAQVEAQLDADWVSGTDIWPSSQTNVAGGMFAPPGTLTLANGANSDITLPGTRMAYITGPSSSFSVSGFKGGAGGRMITLFNSTSQNMTITNNATSVAANRIYTQTGADVALTGMSSADFWYSDADSRWILLGTQG